MSQVRFSLPGSSLPLEMATGTTTSSHSADDSPDSQMMQRYIEGEKYKMRHRRLRKTMKAMVFENAALCDEVASMNEKILRSKEERRFLLKKLYTFEGPIETNNQVSPRQLSSQYSVSPKASSTGGATGSGTSKVTSESSESFKCKRKAITHSKPPSKESMSSGTKSTAKRKRPSAAIKRLVQPITVDSVGRPAFPIVLGGLTVHSLGEIVSDRSSFYTEDYIFPVGFCSTRIYASRKNAELKCLYTCKISDGGIGPSFEISADDDPEHLIVAESASDCHRSLLRAVNSASGTSVVDTTGQGAEFFGFSHPTIQNLIQSSHGARKCSSYKWVKFEVCKPDQVVEMAYCMSDNDPTISFDALQRNIHATTGGVANQERKSTVDTNDSTNLRNLLSKNANTAI